MSAYLWCAHCQAMYQQRSVSERPLDPTVPTYPREVFHRDSLWKQVSSKGSKKPLETDAGGNGHSARAEMV